MRPVKSLRNPVVDLILLFVLAGFIWWGLFTTHASDAVFGLAIITMCALAGIVGGRLLDHWD
jgi:hypothetical protein